MEDRPINSYLEILLIRPQRIKGIAQAGFGTRSAPSPLRGSPPRQALDPIAENLVVHVQLLLGEQPSGGCTGRPQPFFRLLLCGL